MNKKHIITLGSKIGAAIESLIEARNNARRLLRECVSEVGSIEFPKSNIEPMTGNSLIDLADSLERHSVQVTIMPDTMTREVRGFVAGLRYDKEEDEVFIDVMYYSGDNPVKETFRIHEVVEQEKLLDFVTSFAK